MAAGVIGLASGAVLGASGLCPIVKRLWTPSWVLFSGGWCFLILAGLYWLVDLRGHKRCVFPLVVIGMNSIAAYCMAHLFGGFISDSLRIHLGGEVFRFLSAAYEPLLHGAAVLLLFWLTLFWMFRRKIFLRI